MKKNDVSSDRLVNFGKANYTHTAFVTDVDFGLG
jgi:hypothetical protein